MLDLFLFDLGQQQNHEKKGRSHPVSLGIGSVEPIRDCLDRGANLSPLDSDLGLQCL
jgi:hypothetical protein